MKRNSLPASALAEADVLRRALDALCHKLDGKAAAAKTARRKRAAFNEGLNTAVEKGYFAAMRPAEVIHLRIDQCHLPKTGWGMLNLSGGVVTSGKEWTDDGEVREVHSLKRRAASATRPVPIPPQFVRMLRAHVKRFDVAPDGRLFRDQAANYVDVAAYGITWARAR
ncbi:hypothetical protein OG978_02800 [Streptomyces sp. NBC_01591]|uniref:hypothetical protein n=1 Tax=Streptomyces sp. NBC_01591 TaxID=2975888 RepID=UPI002DD8464F|nr:hypothetical protein [Streptomyces sp. NBC_01591]WSD66431.1 hypothetical protein OG978_02800 [Streptomyces sp. NBC_01591]